MTDKKRGRASKVDLLPSDIKSQLTLMLRDKKLSQSMILGEINQLILDAGLEEEHCLSRSGLNRFSSKMEEMSSRIRESREMAEIWTKQFGEAPQSDVGKMLLEFIKQLAFETTMSVGESGKEVDIKALNQLALVVQRVEQAETSSFKREQAIRKEVATIAADTAERVVSEAGLSADTVKMIKHQILGIADD